MSQTAEPRRVPCPSCRQDSIFSPENRWRPFCSVRCRERDLGAWGNEEFRVPAAPPQEGDPEPPMVSTRP